MVPLCCLQPVSYNKFNSFVTDLHESLQLDNEVRFFQIPAVPTRFSDASADNQNFFQCYRKHPIDVIRKRIPNVRPNDTPRQARIFSKRRRRNDCFRFGKAWKPGNLSQSGFITEFARNSFCIREYPVYIVQYLVLGIKGEMNDHILHRNLKTRHLQNNPLDFQMTMTLLSLLILLFRKLLIEHKRQLISNNCTRNTQHIFRQYLCANQSLFSKAIL